MFKGNLAKNKNITGNVDNLSGFLQKLIALEKTKYYNLHEKTIS